MSTTPEPAVGGQCRRALENASPISRRDDLFCEIEDFYARETALLDADRLDEWLELLAEDIRYMMPIRTTQHRGEGPGFSTTTSFYDDNLGSLKTRVRRVTASENAWAEDPPSRARRFVTNLRAAMCDDGTIATSTYILLVRNRGDASDHELLSAERIDVLRQRPNSHLELVSREILLDQAVVGTVNLGLLL